MTDFAHDSMSALRLAERAAKLEGAHEGTVNDIVRLEHAVDDLRREIHGLTVEIRRSHTGATWAAIFAGAFAGSVSGFGTSVAAVIWLVSRGVLHL